MKIHIAELITITSNKIYRLLRYTLLESHYKILNFLKGYSYSIIFYKNVADFIIEQSIFNGGVKIREKCISNILKYFIYFGKEEPKYKNTFSMFFDRKTWIDMPRQNIYHI